MITEPAAPRRVLVVDDDAAQLKLSRLRLQAAGFEVDTAEDATTALDILCRQRPDAIMSDVLMGDVDGFGLCRRIRERPALDDVPVILLSAHYDDREDRALATRVGASELVLRTPTFDAELAALQRTLVDDRPAPPTPADRALYEQHLRTNAHQLAKLLAQAQRTEDRYRKLLEHAHDAIMITTPDGVIVEANGRWRDVLGIPIESLIGKNIYDYGVAPERRVAEASFLASGGGTLGPASFARADGRVVQMVLSLTVVEIEGEPLVLSIGNDVTKMIEIEKRYQSLVERIPDVIWTQPANQQTFYTRNAENLFGESLAALSVKDASARLAQIHPDDALVVRRAFDAYFHGGTTFDLEYRFRRKDGRWLWLRDRSFAITEKDGARVSEGMISDITERKRLEEDLRQSQKMEALGQLTGGIAHDFNNILAIILANAQFLIDALPEGDPRRDDANAVREAGERAVRLTRHLLAFSRRQFLDPRVVELNNAILGVQRMLRSIIREDIAFTFEPNDRPGHVRIDLGQLEQVIMNMVVNACDAMPSGGKLTIQTDDEPAGIVIRIRDTGHGMDEQTQRHIFEPFFTTKEKGRGTGLGLSTCYGIVKQSGGTIRAESEVGVGTTFTIVLPRVRDDEPLPAPGATPDALGGKETILLIEDDLAVRAVVKRLLERRGYRVLAPEDTDEAVHLGSDSSAHVDLILSDIVMPGACGPEVVTRIRQSVPGMKALFMSGYADLPSLAKATLASGTRIIEKPFTPSKLLSALRAELAS